MYKDDIGIQLMNVRIKRVRSLTDVKSGAGINCSYRRNLMWTIPYLENSKPKYRRAWSLRTLLEKTLSTQIQVE